MFWCFFFVFIGFSAQGINLKCNNVDDIQKKYFESHIHFSNSSKKDRKFKKQLSILRNRIRTQLVSSIDPEKFILLSLM